MFYLKPNSESGAALVVALLITFLGSILVSSFLTMANHETRQSTMQRHKVQSFFLAEAGIEKGLYYLNNPENRPADWTLDENGDLMTPLYASGELASGYYDITLYDRSDMPFLPENSYLIRSRGTMLLSDEYIENKVSCIAARLDGIPVPAALAIFDDTDPEDELLKFASSAWTIDGRDMNDPFYPLAAKGLPGIAVANLGDDVDIQLGHRLDQVTGSDEFANITEGLAAILEDPTMPKNLDAYANYFRRIAINISGLGSIPDSAFGTPDDYEIVYCDLSQGDLKLAANKIGNGVLILEGNGDFEMGGGAGWNGIVICAGDSQISITGAGGGAANKRSFIRGALLLANGNVTMNGTADINYSSENIAKVNMQLVLYQVYSWCGGWGQPL